MSVQFILGRSGTGKTSFCINSIADALSSAARHQPLVLLVPEQATYQAERAVLNDKRITGYSRLKVLSFDRLAFLLSGAKATQLDLSQIGREMLIHRILRRNRDRLKIFGPVALRQGLSGQIAKTITQLHEHTKTPDELARLVAKLKEDRQQNSSFLKFTDIALIFGEYLKFIDGKFIAPDRRLIQTCAAVGETDFIKSAKLWVDGFSGFTEAELAVLTEMLKTAEDSKIAICLAPSKIDLKNPDAERTSHLGLFSPTERTYAGLVRIIKNCNLEIAEPKIFDKPVRFSKSDQLAHIEKNIFEHRPPKLPAGDNVLVVSTADVRSEVQFIAVQIRKLIREKAFRYRDIAVIVSDIRQYQHYIKTCFDDYKIPFFIDQRIPLSRHLLVEFLCSAMRVVLDGFDTAALLGLLKTGLVPIERSHIDQLENYCLAFGIDNSDWQSDKDWHFKSEDNDFFDECRIDKTRRKIITPLLKLQQSLCPQEHPEGEITAETFTEAVLEFLDDFEVPQMINLRIDQAVNAGDVQTAGEHRQFYGRFMELFDELTAVFAGQQMSCRDFFALINSAFFQLKLALIPPAIDQVLVGSIERSRHPDLKAVFLAGATQRQFPSLISSDALLGADDIRAAETAGFQLAPMPERTVLERQYLAYIAFTRPSEFLYISYPAVDGMGNAQTCSDFVVRMQSLFEPAAERFPKYLPDINSIKNPAELSELLCSRLGKDPGDCEPSENALLAELLNQLGKDRQFSRLTDDIRSAVNYENRAVLDKSVSAELFGTCINSSASRLTTFACCPYRYFAEYILRLQPRQRLEFKPINMGIFYHSVLDAFLKQLNRQHKSWAELEEKQLGSLLAGQISRFTREGTSISKFISRRRHNSFIIESACDVLEDFIYAAAEMLRAGSFRPTLSEVSFGRKSEGLGEFKIPLSGGRFLGLNGKIDRLDFADIDGEKTAVIFDYKRNKTAFNLSRLYHGLDMQLAVYILAARNSSAAKTRKIAGAFYLPVEPKIQPTAPDRLDSRKSKFDYKASGLFNGDFAEYLDGKTGSGHSPFYNFQFAQKTGQYGGYSSSGAFKPDDFEMVLNFASGKAASLAEEMFAGTIDIKPYRLASAGACDNCSYRPLCRFDWQINNYNNLKSMSKIQLLEKMRLI